MKGWGVFLNCFCWHQVLLRCLLIQSSWNQQISICFSSVFLNCFQLLCFSASVEASAALARTLCLSGEWDLEVSLLFFLEMRNICPIDSTEALLSVPKACSLHCCPAFTAELFIPVSRVSQLTHWGALCTEGAVHNGGGKERIWDTSAGEMRGKCMRVCAFFFFFFLKGEGPQLL